MQKHTRTPASNPRLPDLDELRRPADFVEDHPHLIRSYAAFRRQLDKRDENGLLESGAILETKLGLLVHPERYREWALQPRSGWATQ